MISIGAAKRRAEKGLARAKKKQLKVIDRKIKKTAAAGDSSITLVRLFDETVKVLRNKGYEVEVENPNSNLYSIHWK